MDMWKPFHNVTAARAPQAAILYCLQRFEFALKPAV
jgi:hypothetical protein